MSSLLPGFEYDIFISYRQKDNKHDGWVTEFVDQLKGELESTFKEEISVYFDINPTDGLLETHDVDASLKDKLKCLVFIPIISRTYCDPRSFAWEHEFKAFVEQASKDRFGLKIKLPNGNVSSRVLPIIIHDLDKDDIRQCESILGGYLRGIEFIYKEPGVNRPLTPVDDEKKNLNTTRYRNQINKVANAIEGIIHTLKKAPTEQAEEKQQGRLSEGNKDYESRKLKNKATGSSLLNKWLIISLVLILCLGGAYALFKIISSGKPSENLTIREKSIAVLPFVNDSPDKENEYFCNGMMEEILNQLQKIKDLRVKARTSVEKYRNPNEDIKEIGRELGVSLIMEGSVRKSGDDLRITAQLINAKSGNHLWSETYDGKYTEEIFEFQSNVAKKVAASLNAVITPNEKKRLDEKPTSNMQAYDLCVKAAGMIDRAIFTGDSLYLRLAQNIINRAMELDPEFPDVINGMGNVFIWRSNYDSALIYYRKALEIDPENLSAMQGIGTSYGYLGKYDSTLKYYQKVLDIAPNDLGVNEQMGELLCLCINDAVAGLPYFQKAIDLGGSSEAWVNQFLAFAFFQIGEYQKALKYMNKACSLSSECVYFMLYSHLLFIQGKYDEALQYLDSICSITACEPNCDFMRFAIYISLKEYEKAEKFYNKALNGGFKGYAGLDIYLAYMYIKTGRKNKAVSILNNSIKNYEIQLKNGKVWATGIPYLGLAASYAMMDENKKALYYLSELEKTGLFEMPCTLSSFPFDNLRNDPEFKAIVKRLEDKRAVDRRKIREMVERGEINL